MTSRFESMDALLAALSPREVRRARGQRVAAGMIGVFAAVVAGVWTWQLLTRDPCAGAEQSLEQSWSREVNEALRGSLAGIDAAYAPHAASGAVAVMDAWASAWKFARRESCDPSSVTRTFSNQCGTFEIRESLFAGRGGFVKFESTWQVLEDGARRFATAIPFGGP